MPSIKSFYHNIIWILKGVQTIGLVGKAGTGKSFRAQLVSQKYGIDLIIDDGLLIKNQRILAGKSAKQEKGGYSAIKTALFHDPQHTQEVRSALEEVSFKRILILGTSNRMVHRIAKKMGLPSPTRIIGIEDIATREEIERARRSRMQEGKHIIPVPAVEVKRNHGRIFFDTVRIFFKKRFGLRKNTKIFEKSVVRPLFSSKGRVAISEEALTQMVLHCVSDYDPAYRVKKVLIYERKNRYNVEVFLDVPYRTTLSGPIHDLQNYIVENIQKFTGLDLEEVNVTVDDIS